MASKRDKDFHFLRNSEKYLGKWWRDAHVFQNGIKSSEISEREAAYNAVWAKYGFKSMVSDKRRRNTTRKSNQKFKPMQRQIDRAKFKEETRQLINADC